MAREIGTIRTAERTRCESCGVHVLPVHPEQGERRMWWECSALVEHTPERCRARR